MMPTIHPTAIVEQAARLGEGAVIGPYCCVGGAVEIGDRFTVPGDGARAAIAMLGRRVEEHRTGAQQAERLERDQLRIARADAETVERAGG